MATDGANEFLAGFAAYPLLAACVLFVGVLAAMAIGRRIGRNAEPTPGANAINGAIFAILGLILAFTFSGAAARFDQRRALIVEEANNIGTAYLRIDVAPADAQPALREAFTRYVAARVTAYRHVNDEAAFRAGLNNASLISREIWGLAVAAGHRADALPATDIILLPAINAMIDVTATRAAMMLMHPPAAIPVMLIILALISAVLVGVGFTDTRRREWVHSLSFAAIMTATITITIDLEYPRVGLIRVDGFENAIIATNPIN